MKFQKRLSVLFLLFVLFAGCFVLTTSAAEEENVVYGVGYVLTSKLNIYRSIHFDSEIIDTASEGDCVVVIRKSSRDESWYRVNYNNQEGYVRTYCLDVHTEENIELGYGEINDDIVYLRSGPGTEYTIVSSGFKGKKFSIIGIQNGWYRIIYKSATAYVRSDLINLTEIPYQNDASEIKPLFYDHGKTIGELTFSETKAVAMAAPGEYYAPVSGAALLARAQKYIGTPYIFGGASPEGFDCSGLIFYVLTEMGRSSYRTAADQYMMGVSVDRSDLRPGDLIFFSNTYKSGISHVGIYAGNGTFLHAPKEGSTVSYSNLSGYWSNHYYGARRIG